MVEVELQKNNSNFSHSLQSKDALLAYLFREKDVMLRMRVSN